MARPKKPQGPIAFGDEINPFDPPPGVVPKEIGLTQDERVEIEAAAQEEIRELLKQQEKDAFRKEAITRAKVEAGLLPRTAHEPDVTLIIDVAKYADRITIDGRSYMHGRRYTVSAAVGRTLMEIMRRTHEHENETKGESRFGALQKAKDIRILPNGSVVNTTASMRAH